MVDPADVKEASQKRSKSEDDDIINDDGPTKKKAKAELKEDSDGNNNEEDASNPPQMSKAREIRLEQNRKASREWRRRKKVLQEELQRSVIFFSRGELLHTYFYGLWSVPLCCLR